MKTKVVESATIWRATDPNYPGVPQPPESRPAPAKTTRRANADFEEYVLRYAATQRTNTFIMLAGLGLIVGSGMYLNGPLMVILVSLGLALTGGGLAAIAIAMSAHAAYTRYLGMNETEEYAPPAPPAPTVRPFVASRNGPSTIRVGRFSLPSDKWAALYDAVGPNGKLTRDIAAKTLPRELYRDWQQTVGEMQRLDLLDAEARPTAKFKSLAGHDSPFPEDDEPLPRAHSTHARRTVRAHGDSEVREWGE